MTQEEIFDEYARLSIERELIRIQISKLQSDCVHPNVEIAHRGDTGGYDGNRYCIHAKTASNSGQRRNNMDYKTTENFIKSLLEIKRNEHDIFNIMPWNRYIDDYRTIHLKLPRGIGKTKFINEYADKHSAYLINVNKKFSVSSFENKFRGIRTNGLKYQCILVDEPLISIGNPNLGFYDAVLFLNTYNLLTEDFYILMIGD